MQKNDVRNIRLVFDAYVKISPYPRKITLLSDEATRVRIHQIENLQGKSIPRSWIIPYRLYCFRNWYFIMFSTFCHNWKCLFYCLKCVLFQVWKHHKWSVFRTHAHWWVSDVLWWGHADPSIGCGFYCTKCHHLCQPESRYCLEKRLLKQ